MDKNTFPNDFVWGAAAASYQVEGAMAEDGKGFSVWDMFCRKPGAVANNHNGDVACDHYHRWQEDINLMKGIGLRAYRLSISWPRVLPDGTRSVNAKGLDFYDKLVDGLLAAGIAPYVTLFHWDLPYALYFRGSWLNPYSPDWFAEYTEVVVRKLGDRVKHWMTLNEPQVFLGLGYQVGKHAPGLQLPMNEVLQAGHNALLAHGKAVQVIRAASSVPCKVGYAPVGIVFVPASSDPADIETARKMTFQSPRGEHLWVNTWFSDPIFFKQYPEEGLAAFGKNAPRVGPQDMEVIGQPLDFYGFNNYSSMVVRAGKSGEPEFLPFPDGHPRTGYGWWVVPEGLYWGPKFFWERYHQPILVTENGLSNLDWVSQDGAVHDPQRIDFTARYLLALRRASLEGVPVMGYFHWSIMDNFEWNEGYTHRFGLIYVNFQTQERILKDSAHWYREVIATNGACLDG